MFYSIILTITVHNISPIGSVVFMWLTVKHKNTHTDTMLVHLSLVRCHHLQQFVYTYVQTAITVNVKFTSQCCKKITCRQRIDLVPGGTRCGEDLARAQNYRQIAAGSGLDVPASNPPPPLLSKLNFRTSKNKQYSFRAFLIIKRGDFWCIRKFQYFPKVGFGRQA